jgi:hypothetical protein
MTITLREGGYYRTRNGLKAGPAVLLHESDAGYARMSLDGDMRYFHLDGTHGNDVAIKNIPDYDLIAEWHDGPVRVVTRKQIVPGTYGIVRVFERDNEWLPLRIEMPALGYSSAELRAAAATLTEIADALDDGVTAS